MIWISPQISSHPFKPKFTVPRRWIWNRDGETRCSVNSQQITHAGTGVTPNLLLSSKIRGSPSRGTIGTDVAQQTLCWYDMMLWCMIRWSASWQHTCNGVNSHVWQCGGNQSALPLCCVKVVFWNVRKQACVIGSTGEGRKPLSMFERVLTNLR